VTPRTATHRAAVLRCMQGAQRARDGRGVYQNRTALESRLLRDDVTPTIARMTAEAAVAVALAIRRFAA
jgi:hypothetical protein